MAHLTQFGASLETTKDWITELMDTLQVSEGQACKIFRASIHELRDLLSDEEIADLSAQLPLLLRGILFEGWSPHRKQSNRRSKNDFLERISKAMSEEFSVEELEPKVKDVFRFLDRRVSAGEIRHIVNSLPKELRTLWPEYCGDRRSA